MIPKTIHYCWFGRNSLPQDALKCIASWRKHFPDYEIKEWNEDNFDVNICQYTREAYKAKKYAFVSDYARFWILYNYGGLYFDTDVEVIRPMDEIISKGPFMGIEKSLATKGQGGMVGVNPGLVLGAEAGLPIYREILDFYESKSYKEETVTVVINTTNILRNHGFENKNCLQQVAGLTIYPDDVFCPMDSTTGLIHITPDTVSIHHYSCSWINHHTIGWKIHILKNKLIKIFGQNTIMTLTRLLKR